MIVFAYLFIRRAGQVVDEFSYKQVSYELVCGKLVSSMWRSAARDMTCHSYALVTGRGYLPARAEFSSLLEEHSHLL